MKRNSENLELKNLYNFFPFTRLQMCRIWDLEYFYLFINKYILNVYKKSGRHYGDLLKSSQSNKKDIALA